MVQVYLLPSPELTEREAQILRLAAEGATNKSIGLVLGLSEYTVRNHLYQVMAKMRAKNRTHAVSIYYGLSETSVTTA